jgi:hypothetical protein
MKLESDDEAGRVRHRPIPMNSTIMAKNRKVGSKDRQMKDGQKMNKIE